MFILSTFVAVTTLAPRPRVCPLTPPPSDRAARPSVHLSRRPGTCRRRLSLRIGLVTLVSMLALTASAVGQTQDPVQFLFAFNHDVSTQLDPTSLDPGERKRRFAALVSEGLDLDVIGQCPLGRRWTGATLADRQTFRREFRDYLVQSFAMKVKGVDDGRMTVTKVIHEGNTVLILTEVVTEHANREAFAWRVVHTTAGWRLCDVIVNNVSIAAIMRSQFDSLLQDDQSDIRPLLRLLHERSLE
jgi:phospholipid transport system substrate-binding protein